MNKSQRQRCERYCGGQIQGIVERLKLNGTISEGFEAEIKPLKAPLNFIPGDSFVLSCPLHKRRFLIRRK